MTLSRHFTLPSSFRYANSSNYYKSTCFISIDVSRRGTLFEKYASGNTIANHHGSNHWNIITVLCARYIWKVCLDRNAVKITDWFLQKYIAYQEQLRFRISQWRNLKGRCSSTLHPTNDEVSGTFLMAWSVMLISLSRLSYNFPFHLLVSVKGPRIECSETPYVCTVSSLCYLSLNGWAGLDFISYFAVISLKQKGHAS